MDIEAFDYPLTEAHVARYPVFPQGSSRLLYYDSRTLSHRSFSDITTCLPLRSVLLCNNSEVLPVRLYFSYRGRKVEVFLLSVKGYADLGMALGLKGEAEVKALVPHSKRLRGCTLRSVKGHRTIFFSYGNEAEDMHRLHWLPSHLSFGEILHAFGHMPLPPYMNREATKEDITHYQGPFAQVPGSVAAPTASFHFTAPLLRALEAAGHMRISFTLAYWGGDIYAYTCDGGRGAYIACGALVYFYGCHRIVGEDVGKRAFYGCGRDYGIACGGECVLVWLFVVCEKGGGI